MRSCLGFPMALAAGLIVTAFGAGQGVAQTVVPPGTHRCAAGQDITVEASKGSFKIVGPCRKIAIKGAGNELSVESAKSVDIDGPDNQLEIDAVDDVKAIADGVTIVYRRGLTRPTASIVTLGDNSKIVQAK